MPLGLQVGVRGVKEGVIVFRVLGLRLGVEVQGAFLDPKGPTCSDFLYTSQKGRFFGGLGRV